MEKLSRGSELTFGEIKTTYRQVERWPQSYFKSLMLAYMDLLSGHEKISNKILLQTMKIRHLENLSVIDDDLSEEKLEKLTQLFKMMFERFEETLNPSIYRALLRYHLVFLENTLGNSDLESLKSKWTALLEDDENIFSVNYVLRLPHSALPLWEMEGQFELIDKTLNKIIENKILYTSFCYDLGPYTRFFWPTSYDQRQSYLYESELLRNDRQGICYFYYLESKKNPYLSNLETEKQVLSRGNVWQKRSLYQSYFSQPPYIKYMLYELVKLGDLAVEFYDEN